MNKAKTLIVLVCSCILTLMMPLGAHAQEEEAADIHARYAAAADLQTMQVLYERDAQKRMYPASLTKVLTVLTAMDEIDDLEETVTISIEMLTGLEDGALSIAGFLIGEEVTMRDLIYGALLPSGADACQALAVALFGSEEAMAAAMNEKASSIGMTHSHFTNTVGMHDADHYTTAADLVLLMRQAWQNETIKAAMSASAYTTMPNDLHGEGLSLESSWIRQFAYADEENIYVKGAKTGYTPQAGYCLASICEIQGREVIVIVAGVQAETTFQGETASDTTAICTQIDTQMRTENVLQADEPAGMLDLRHTFHDPLPIQSEEDVDVWVSKKEDAQLQVSVRYEVSQAPVSEGERIAQIEICAGDELLLTLPVYAEEDISAETGAVIIDTIQDVMMPYGFLACICAGAFILIWRKREQREKKEGI